MAMIKNYWKLILLLIIICFFSGCTSTQIYDGFQQSQYDQCLKLLDQSEQRRCLDELMSHDEYQKEKESAKD